MTTAGRTTGTTAGTSVTPPPPRRGATPEPELVGVPVAVRPGGSVQLGSSPRSAGVLGPVPRATADDLLAAARAPLGPDPSPRVRSATALRRWARDGLLAPGRALGGARLLTEDPATAALAPDAARWAGWDPRGPAGPARLAGRRGAAVAVVGCGRTGTALAAVLAAAGVGGLVLVDDAAASRADSAPGGAGPDDAGRPRGEVAADRAGAVAPGGLREVRGPADLVVLLDHHVARSGAAEGLLADGVAHLSVVLRDTDAVVGPLVLPGSTPCLRCLDLHRTDADPGWPSVLAQWTVPVRGPAGQVLPEESAAASAVAGLVALQVLHHLDGGRASATGTTLELLLPEGVVQQRRWSPHPGCGCTELPLG